jgi:hypothetical protein
MGRWEVQQLRALRVILIFASFRCSTLFLAITLTICHVQYTSHTPRLQIKGLGLSTQLKIYNPQPDRRLSNKLLVLEITIHRS